MASVVPGLSSSGNEYDRSFASQAINKQGDVHQRISTVWSSRKLPIMARENSRWKVAATVVVALVALAVFAALVSNPFGLGLLGTIAIVAGIGIAVLCIGRGIVLWSRARENSLLEKDQRLLEEYKSQTDGHLTQENLDLLYLSSRAKQKIRGIENEDNNLTLDGNSIDRYELDEYLTVDQLKAALNNREVSEEEREQSDQENLEQIQKDIGRGGGIGSTVLIIGDHTIQSTDDVQRVIMQQFPEITPAQYSTLLGMLHQGIFDEAQKLAAQKGFHNIDLDRNTTIKVEKDPLSGKLLIESKKKCIIQKQDHQAATMKYYDYLRGLVSAYSTRMHSPPSLYQPITAILKERFRNGEGAAEMLYFSSIGIGEMTVKADLSDNTVTSSVRLTQANPEYLPSIPTQS